MATLRDLGKLMDQTTIHEQEFFGDRGVRVTNARFIVPGKTYAMSGITSVAVGRTRDGRGWPALFLLMIAIWALGAARSNGSIILATMGIVACAAWFRGASPRWVVRLFTAGGQQEEVESKDRAFVERVVAGLNEAIIARDRLRH